MTQTVGFVRDVIIKDLKNLTNVIDQVHNMHNVLDQSPITLTTTTYAFHRFLWHLLCNFEDSGCFKQLKCSEYINIISAWKSGQLTGN